MKSLGFLFALALAISLAPAAEAARRPAEGDASAEPRRLLDAVAARLQAVAEPASDLPWPPTIILGEDAGVFAGTILEHGVVNIYVSTDMMDQVVEGKEDRLALVLAHEMAHALLGQLTEAYDAAPRASTEAARTPFVEAAFGRSQELAADSLGVRLMLAAGFSYRGGLDGIRRMMDLGLDYTSFEGPGLNHPAWVERLARIDSSRAPLWRSIGAFDNGVLFLMIEQYGAAARSFQSVVADDNFPGCAEAWANLGHALLMQYCDALDPADLRSFEVGQLVTTGFYRRPASLEAQVRGIDQGLWWDAIGALREAIRLDPGLTLARADLGIAYLVGPAGKDVGQASRFLSEAASAARDDEQLDPLVRAAIMLNSGVGELASSHGDAGQRQMAQTEELLKASLGLPIGRAWELGAVVQSLVYNRGFLLAASTRPQDRRQAVQLLEEYLASTSRASAWWQLAHERYAQLCLDLAIPVKDFDRRDDETAAAPLRPVVSVVTTARGPITLTDRVERLEKQLGHGEVVRLVPGTNLKRIHYRGLGVDVLAGEEVIALVMPDSTSPPVSLRPQGVGAASTAIRVGMPIAEFDTVMGDRPFDVRNLLDPKERYRFYRDAGIGVRVVGGRIAEIVVAQIPLREG